MAWLISDKKPAVTFLFLPLRIMYCHPPLAAFFFCFFSPPSPTLVWSNLVMMCLGVILLVVLVLGVHWDSSVYFFFFFFNQTWKNFGCYCFSIFPLPHCSLWWPLIICVLGCMKLSHGRLYLPFRSCFHSSVWVASMALVLPLPILTSAVFNMSHPVLFFSFSD